MKKTFTEWCRYGNTKTAITQEIYSKINECIESVNDWAEWSVLRLNKQKYSIHKK